MINKIRVAINGFGRIGRLTFRELFENQANIEIVAINDLTAPKVLAYLLENDTAHRMFKKNISYTSTSIIVDGKEINIVAEKDPSLLPWKQYNVDIVIEATGFFATYQGAKKHLAAGAKKVIVSAPVKDLEVKNIVYNVNHTIIDKTDQIISAASCTTNCLAPIIKIMETSFGILNGYMTTIHALTNDQKLLDLPHTDLRRGRSAFSNIVPTSTGAAQAIWRVIPSLKGKLSGTALRVPILTGSIIDLTLNLQKKTSKEEINQLFERSKNETLAYCTKEIVSSDIIGSSFGSIFDATLTEVVESPNGSQIVKLFSWYDNEYSYVHQLVRTLKYFAKIDA